MHPIMNEIIKFKKTTSLITNHHKIARNHYKHYITNQIELDFEDWNNALAKLTVQMNIMFVLLKLFFF